MTCLIFFKNGFSVCLSVCFFTERKAHQLQALPEVVAARGQDDAMRGEAFALHDEGNVAVVLTQRQRAQLLRQQVDVVDLRHRGRRPQGMAVIAHAGVGAHLPTAKQTAQANGERESKLGGLLSLLSFN